MSNNLTIDTAEPFFIPGNKTGCLLVHGFTGTPKEMKQLGDSLASEGYTILAPRLFGHATQPSDMNRARWNDWLASVEDGYNILKGCTEKQFIMGLSMGGILSLIAAARYDFKGVVTFSAPYAIPQAPPERIMPVLVPFKPKARKGISDWRNQDAANDHKDYPYYPTRAVIELLKLIKETRAELSRVTIPALLVQSHLDTSIPEESLEYFYEHISSTDKAKLWVKNSGHVIIREPDREEIFEAVKSFMKRVLTSE